MSGMGLTLGATRQNSAGQGGASGFNPVQLSPITAWLRNQTLSGGVAEVPDVLLGPSALQATGTKQPTGAADASMTFDGVDDCFSLAVAASNSATAGFGFGGWINPTDTAANRAFMRRGNGSVPAVPTPGNSFYTEIIGDGGGSHALRWNINIDALGVNVRQASCSISPGTDPFFYWWQFDGSQATDATKVQFYTAGAFQTLAFGVDSGVAAEMPTALQPAPQPQLLLINREVGASGPFGGRTGQNIYISNGPLTLAQLNALAAFEPLV